MVSQRPNARMLHFFVPARVLRVRTKVLGYVVRGARPLAHFPPSSPLSFSPQPSSHPTASLCASLSHAKGLKNSTPRSHLCFSLVLLPLSSPTMVSAAELQALHQQQAASTVQSTAPVNDPFPSIGTQDPFPEVKAGAGHANGRTSGTNGRSNGSSRQPDL